MRHSIDVLDFRPLTKNTLRGFCKMRIRELNLVVSDISVRQQGSARWAGLPAKPQIRDGAVVVDPTTHKPAHVAILEFETKATRDAFSAAVINALLDRYPDAFTRGETL
jgi:hypothetical protein